MTKTKLKDFWQVWVNTFKSWNESDPFIQSASISYFAIFSIPGLLIIILWVSSIFVDSEMVREQISGEIAEVLGRDSADTVEGIVEETAVDDSGFLIKLVGTGALLFGATTLFFQLQKVLNNLWRVKAIPKNNLKKLLLDRASSLGLILVIAFLLLISLVVASVIGATSEWISSRFGQEIYYVVEGVNFLISIAVISLLFAMMFKVLPDVEIGWRSVWIGSLVTAVLFTLGKFLVGLYFSLADPSSGFGAAGTVILLMLWVNFSCLIFFLGAQFTKEFAVFYGHRIEPSKHAKWMDDQHLADPLAPERVSTSE